MPPHPLGVEPEGNLFLQAASVKAEAVAVRCRGLGARLARLGDATVLDVLSFLAPSALGVVCGSSKVLGAYACFEELWKEACVRRHNGGVLPAWRGSWRETWAGAEARASAAVVRPRLFSDALFRPHLLAHSPSPFGERATGPPCERVSGLDARAFSARFEAGGGTPVVLVGLGAAAAAEEAWGEPGLGGAFGKRIYHAGGVNFRMEDYLKYGKENVDDPPLYVFDPTFGASTPELLDCYEPPAHFRDDLFDLLGDDERPDYRWLLVGGSRSGQSWHTDPNSTSAWNLTLRGRKRWLFFPPGVRPPGVLPAVDGDGDNYLAPVSNMEWARAGFYAEAKAHPKFLEADADPGDVVYVPRGWWHMVVNMAPLTVAVSHHFVSPAGLPNVLKRLRDTPEHVSGVDRGLAKDDDRDGAGPTNKRRRSDSDRHAARPLPAPN